MQMESGSSSVWTHDCLELQMDDVLWFVYDGRHFHRHERWKWSNYVLPLKRCENAIERWSATKQLDHFKINSALFDAFTFVQHIHK